ncbi:hypothetical protein C8J56DRAFT_994135 [Mycena floridula]|nr:hypothetical protein C8J56DRAFT_994135 [Mycena floridula]
MPTSPTLLQICIQYSSIALLYYDYILTFPREVKYIWTRKFQLSSLLYIFCRYALIANILYLLAITNKLGDACDRWYKIIGVLSLLGRGSVIVTFIARTYAIYSGSRLVLVYLGVLGLTCLVLDITHVPGLRCSGPSKLPIVDTLLSILMVSFEFSSTWLLTLRSIQTLKMGGPWKTQRSGFVFLLFEQENSFVSLFSVAAVVLNFSGFLQRLVNALTLPISCLMTARFLLHLREWDHNRATKFGVSSTKPSFVRTQTLSIPVFSKPRTTPSIIDEFGQDPVVMAQEGRHAFEPSVTESDWTAATQINPPSQAHSRQNSAPDMA